MRQRPASLPPSPITVIVATVAVLAAAVALTWFAIVAPRGVPGVSYRYLDAQFADASNVPLSSEVRIAGRRVGQVTGASLHQGVATLHLQIEPGTSPLRADTRARIRLKGLLGGKFVELTPGTRGAVLRSGATLPESRTSTATDLLDALQALDAPTRRNLQRTVRGLGQGLLGRGSDLNDMLAVAPGVYRHNTALADAVLARSGAAARLVPSAESAAAAVDPVRAQLAAGFKPSAEVLGALADRGAALRATLQIAPPTLAALQRGLDAATPLLDETGGLARAAVKLTAPAPAALHETALLLRQAPAPLRASRPLLASLGRAVQPTLSFLNESAPVVSPATRAMRDGLPPLAELGRRPCDLQAFARNWRSMLGFGVAPGSGDPLGALDDDAGLGALDSLRVVLDAPTTPESLSLDTHTTYRPGSDAYPAPCQAEQERTR